MHKCITTLYKYMLNVLKYMSQKLEEVISVSDLLLTEDLDRVTTFHLGVVGTNACFASEDFFGGGVIGEHMYLGI